ncbi:ImmA/IrrE family metallo-endopeptidase [Enterococcus olivae]
MRSKLKELGISLEVLAIEKQGCYVQKWKRIFVNEALNEEEMKLVVLHELKHVIDHSEYLALYNTFINHSKMENEAKTFMVNYIIAENDGHYNYTQLIEEFDIGMGYDIKFAQ